MRLLSHRMRHMGRISIYTAVSHEPLASPRRVSGRGGIRVVGGVITPRAVWFRTYINVLINLQRERGTRECEI